MKQAFLFAVAASSVNAKLHSGKHKPRAEANPFNLVMLDPTEYPMAVCIDGTPGGYMWKVRNQ